MNNKTCKVCKKVFPILNFHKSSKAKDGHHSYCKKCHSEKVKIYNKNRYDTNQDYKNKCIKSCKKIYEKNKVKIINQNRTRSKILRLTVINGYTNNNPMCACCGEKEYDFLSIDHKKNDGSKHRKESGGAYQSYRWMIKNNFPKDYIQILCHNCNMSKSFLGECPHVTKRKFYEEQGTKDSESD